MLLRAFLIPSLPRYTTLYSSTIRSMATIRASLSHEERTAQEPRQSALEPVILSKIEAVNDTIRLLRLSAVDPKHELKFQPGQWLDVFIPSLSKAGGFTITSTPLREGRPTNARPAYLELAVQSSSNPPAKWLSKPESEILGSRIVVRAGGSFVWPPPGLDERSIEQVVLIAGGVGINPLMSIFSHLLQQPRPPPSIRFVYSTKAEDVDAIDGSRILFLQRLIHLVKEAEGTHIGLEVFITNASEEDISTAKGLPSRAKAGRVTHDDLKVALGDETFRDRTVCYVCGPPRMTDEFVEFLSGRKGMASDRVLCEKWW